MAGVLAMILAGGEGTRLQPLTITRSKPSVPFGGSYRLVDFVLNNFVNSDLLRIYVLTQFKSQSLYMHMKKGWNLTGITGRFIDPIPAQMRMGKRWYDGTADAIYQNISFVELSAPDHVCIFGSDHIYKMDIRQMLEYHKHKQAVLTVAAIRVPLAEASSFGIIEVDEAGLMVGFDEKPRHPKPIPGDPDHALASMGNYIFETQTLLSELSQDAAKEDSSHDFGRDIIPSLYSRAPVYVYDFSSNKVDGEKGGVYWRDVGTLDAYWQAHMDLVSDEPPFTLYNRKWPLHTYYPPLPPATFVNTAEHHANVAFSLVSAGCYLRGCRVERSVLGFRCNLGPDSHISHSVLLGDVKIGEGCRISRAIIDKHVEIAPGTVIGENLQQDRARFTVSDGGIVVVPKGARIGF
ncbi:MAG: glucose-1-phosphate adenylyltransferase [Aeromonadaceae bacterium]|nr:glucose-1-phosphate adenylyltransferase [Aeromonadaceae bacterium]